MRLTRCRLNREQNPYQSPHSNSLNDLSGYADPQRGAERVARGRLMFLAITAFVISLEVGLPLLNHDDPSAIRVGIAMLLLYFAWCGQRWAIFIIAFRQGLGAILSVPTAISAYSQGYPVSCCLSVSVGVLYSATVIGLFFSPSLRAFFKHQQRCRTADSGEGRGGPEEGARVLLPGRAGPVDTPDDDPRVGLDDDAHRLVTIATFDVPVKAEAARLLLDQMGIEAVLTDANLVGMNWALANAVGGAKLQVRAAEAHRAREILAEAPLPARQTRRATDEQDVRFACEECGQALAFPAHRRGGVETCPHCGEYVDVPE